MKHKELYTKETTWGAHWVSEGFGKYEGKFIAQSRGAGGGARGYFAVKDTLEEAKAVVDRETALIINDEPPIKF